MSSELDLTTVIQNTSQNTSICPLDTIYILKFYNIQNLTFDILSPLLLLVYRILASDQHKFYH